jgi:hypothetical protein
VEREWKGSELQCNAVGSLVVVGEWRKGGVGKVECRESRGFRSGEETSSVYLERFRWVRLARRLKLRPILHRGSSLSSVGAPRIPRDSGSELDPAFNFRRYSWYFPNFLPASRPSALPSGCGGRWSRSLFARSGIALLGHHGQRHVICVVDDDLGGLQHGHRVCKRSWRGACRLEASKPFVLCLVTLSPLLGHRDRRAGLRLRQNRHHGYVSISMRAMSPLSLSRELNLSEAN